jgi:ferrous iron transport protein A
MVRLDMSAALALPLLELPTHRSARVVGLRTSADVSPEIVQRLAEIGFLRGEEVRIVARAQPGGTPLAVRIGTATFALRNFEAACVLVSEDVEGPTP